MCPWTGDASTNTQTASALQQTRRQSHPHILQVKISISWKAQRWIMHPLGCTGVKDDVLVFFCFLNRKLWEKISEDLAQKPSQRFVQARLHHSLRVRGAALHSHALLSRHTKGNNRICFVTTRISRALIKYRHAFQPYCNKARLGSFCMCPLGHFLPGNY